MAKAKKHYLEKKIESLNKEYSKIPDQYSELKNIYRGRDKEGKRNKKIHKLKDRYDAAEAYLQTLDKQTLTPEQRKYIAELARTFLEYDLVLDKKRKEPEYKEAVRKKRIEHLGKTLEAMAEDEAPAQPVNKTLDNYVQTPKIVTPTQPKIVMPPDPSVVTNTASGTPRPSLISRMYQSSKNAISSACNSTKDFTKKYWKYGATFVAGAAVGSLLTYYCVTKPVVKPAPPAPPKQEHVIPKQEPKKPIIKKQEPKPIIKKQEPKKETPVIIKEEQKPTAPKIGKGEILDIKSPMPTEKYWTDKIKKGEIDLTKYDVFFSGMWYDPGAIVLYEKGNDRIRFDTAMSGQLMWEDVETKKELEDLVWRMEKNNMFESGRIALHAEYIKNKKGEVLGVIFTDALGRTQVNLKDGKVMVYSIERKNMLNGP